MFEGELCVWFGSKTKGKSLKTSIVGAIHEMLAQVCGNLDMSEENNNVKALVVIFF